MTKFFLLIASTMLTSMFAFSQTTKQKIEKLSKDPTTTEKASKADVYILKNKKVISDSTAKEVCDRKVSPVIKARLLPAYESPDCRRRVPR